MAKTKIKTIDLFAGCGGLTEGFEQSGYYELISAVEWDKAPIDCLRNRMKSKWKMKDADERILRFDMQRSDELIHGWENDPVYGSSRGLEYYVNESGGKLDLIIGGPPCQAYSIAGRVRDENGMRNDYRNYLFESYLAIVKHFNPRAFIFENVPGLLSAKPGDGSFLIVDRIQDEFEKAGYYVLDNLKYAVIDMSEYGIPQKRSRIIILGLNSHFYKREDAESLIWRFYNELLPNYKEKTKTVRDAISDLPKLFPFENDESIRFSGKNQSYSLNPDPNVLPACRPVFFC